MIAVLLRQLDAKRLRIEVLEARQAAAGAFAATAPVQGLNPLDPTAREFTTEEALRPDLPGIAFRVPCTDTQVQLYGSTKHTVWSDFNGRNQSNAPAPLFIPLQSSPADQESVDFGLGFGFGRFGVDSQTLTSLATPRMRIEGDAPASSNAVFRFRQAWAEFRTSTFWIPTFWRLISQADSLWNEGLFKNLIDTANLNQSLIRQVQIGVTGRLAPGLNGHLSLEAPETTYASTSDTFILGESPGRAASPAFNGWPDLLGRLTRQRAGWEFGLRGLLRELRIEPSGMATATVAGGRGATDWSFAAHVRAPMCVLLGRLGPDDLFGMAHNSEGIVRYSFGNRSGQDAVLNLGPASVGLGLGLGPCAGIGPDLRLPALLDAAAFQQTLLSLRAKELSGLGAEARARLGHGDLVGQGVAAGLRQPDLAPFHEAPRRWWRRRWAVGHRDEIPFHPTRRFWRRCRSPRCWRSRHRQPHGTRGDRPLTVLPDALPAQEQRRRTALGCRSAAGDAERRAASRLRPARLAARCPARKPPRRAAR